MTKDEMVENVKLMRLCDIHMNTSIVNKLYQLRSVGGVSLHEGTEAECYAFVTTYAESCGVVAGDAGRKVYWDFDEAVDVATQMHRDGFVRVTIKARKAGGYSVACYVKGSSDVAVLFKRNDTGIR